MLGGEIDAMRALDSVVPVGTASQHDHLAVTTDDGTVHRVRVDQPHGAPADPITNGELVVKFHALAERVTNRERATAIERSVIGLDRLDDFGYLVDLLAAPVAGLAEAHGKDLGRAATAIGDALWNDEELEQTARERIVGLYRLTFRNAEVVLDKARGEPIYLILAMTPDRTLRMKPQNLVTGLPIAHLEAAS